MASSINDLPAGVRTIVKKELTNLKQRVQARMVKEHMSGPTSPNSVSVRSGQLRRSLDGKVSELRGNGSTMFLNMFFGGGVPYARIHEYGGTITPKNAQNLAIPVGAAVTKAGVSRYSGPAAQWGMLKFIKNKKTGKKLLINAALAMHGQVEVWYVLLPSVTLPPRLHFGETFEQEANRTIERLRQVKVDGWTG